MVRTKPKIALLRNTSYYTLENWEGDGGGEQCHKINRIPYILKLISEPLFF